MNAVQFSVVTVMYNSENSIEKTILSVLNQSFSDYEYIIIDGNSSDSSLNIANSFKERFAEKGVSFKIFSEKDDGIYDAMNKGIACSSGEFISFINSGDWYDGDCLLKVHELLLNNHVDLVYGSIHYLKKNGKQFIKKSKKDMFVTSRHWNHPSMFLRKEIYDKYKFDTSFKYYADFNLYLKLRKLKNIKLCINDYPVAFFVADGVSTNSKTRKARCKEKYRAYKENGYSRLYWIETFLGEYLKQIILGI